MSADLSFRIAATIAIVVIALVVRWLVCLLYTSPSPRD